MDPNATLKLVLESQDRYEAYYHMLDLFIWLSNGGFAPILSNMEPVRIVGSNEINSFAIQTVEPNSRNEFEIVKYSFSGNQLEKFVFPNK